MPSRKRKQHPLMSEHVRCYVEWLRLKMSPDYRKASDKIRRLEAKHRNFLSMGLKKATHTLKENATGLTFGRPAAKRSQRLARRAATSVLKAKEEVCKRFGLTIWAHPDDPSVTFANADAIVPPRFPVYAIGPSRTVPVGGRNLGTRATVDGWLTLKIDLLQPLEDTERIVAGFLRAHRRAFVVPKHRLRPASVLKALEVWDCYSKNPQFSSVASQLRRKPSTVKGQYVRGHVLVCGSKPSGSMKQRRLVSIGGDPAEEFQSHLASCSRCLQADSADTLCGKWAAFVSQDQVAVREKPNSPIR